jgi:hypothetical protein
VTHLAEILDNNTYGQVSRGIANHVPYTLHEVVRKDLFNNVQAAMYLRVFSPVYAALSREVMNVAKPG